MDVRCEHPVRIKDPHRPGRYIEVPCGKCAVCLQKRAYSWTKRLKVEASQHRYVFFVTLTYSDEFVPRFLPSQADTYLYLTDLQREKVIEYISQNEVSDQYLVLRYSDLQNFFKRLRNYIYEDKDIKSWQKNLRYFACGEYGETTFRPHYHLLFFLDSEELCRSDANGKNKFESFVYKAWSVPCKDGRKPIGRLSVEYSRGNCAAYTSKYVTSFSDLPKLLRLVGFRPFSRASKCPPIGSFKFDVNEAKQVFTSCSSEFFNSSGSEVDGNERVSIWKSLKDSLFPKTFNYASLSPADRFAAYGIARFPFLGCSYVDFIKWLYVHRDEALAKFLIDLFGCGSFALLTDISSTYYRSLYRLFSISSRVLFNCSLFDVSLLEYVSQIDRFYSESNYSSLVEQLRYEEDFSKNNDVRFLASFVDSSVFSYPHSWAKLTLEGFGFTSDDDPVRFDFYHLREYTQQLDLIHRIVDVGKSYKRKSDYYLSKGLSNLNVI